MKTNILALIAILFGSVQYATAQFDDLYYNPDQDAAELAYDDYDYDEDSYDYDDSDYDYDDREGIRRFSRPAFSGFYNPYYSNYYYASRYNTRNWYADSYYNPRTVVYITFGNTRWNNNLYRTRRFGYNPYAAGFFGNNGGFGNPYSAANSYNYYSYNSAIGNPCAPGYVISSRPSSSQTARSNANFGKRSYGSATSSTKGVRTTGTARSGERTYRDSDRQTRRTRTSRTSRTTTTRDSNRGSYKGDSRRSSNRTSARSSRKSSSRSSGVSRGSSKRSFKSGSSSRGSSSARSSRGSSSRSSGMRRGRGN